MFGDIIDEVKKILLEDFIFKSCKVGLGAIPQNNRKFNSNNST